MFDWQIAFRVFSIAFLMGLARYLVFAGGLYLFLWVWQKDRFQSIKIQKEVPTRKKLVAEFLWSVQTMVVFGFIGILIYWLKTLGITKLYFDFQEYSIGYFILSVILTIIIHDTYFYWAHRLMHVKFLYKWTHKVHHNSTNPSPWASFSFQTTESVLEAMIVPIVIFIYPMHHFAILAFLLFMTFMNVLGHSGYEFYPRGFTTHWFWKWNNTSTHHNMHHRFFNYNYGLYFNWWDRMLGTNHPKYNEVYEDVKDGRPF